MASPDTLSTFVRILLVGALSWNPERIRSLADRGHRLWGCWTRSMGWDQGPYPALDDCVVRVAPDQAAHTIATHDIDCVYALFQVYDEPAWAPATDGVEHSVWTVLRELLSARARGEFEAPIVFHWGFDVHNLDRSVVRALDGHIFCNRELLTWWSTPVADGGCGLDLFDECDTIAFLDGDRPKAEFMHDDVGDVLSARTGELHTVCAGRPVNLDVVALARRGIHLHVYGNGFDDVAAMIVRDIVQRGSERELHRVRNYIHLHPTLQPTGASWDEVRRAKSRWVQELSRYDAGWSYVGTPFPWRQLEDRAAIPNRLSTYLLAGLPVIGERKPGWYRSDELTRLDVQIDLETDGYDTLRASLEMEATTGVKRARALEVRHGYSFDASIVELVDVLEHARTRYFDRPATERHRDVGRDDTPLVRLAWNSRPTRSLTGRVVGKTREIVGRHRDRRIRQLSRALVADRAVP